MQQYHRFANHRFTSLMWLGHLPTTPLSYYIQAHGQSYCNHIVHIQAHRQSHCCSQCNHIVAHSAVILLFTAQSYCCSERSHIVAYNKSNCCSQPNHVVAHIAIMLSYNTHCHHTISQPILCKSSKLKSSVKYMSLTAHHMFLNLQVLICRPKF